MGLSGKPTVVPRKKTEVLKMRKNKGFSLLIVMILSVISMIFIGVSLNFAYNSSGAGRVSDRSNDSYNILQSEIERARSALRLEMSSRKDAMKCGLSENDSINSLDDLEVLKDGAPFWRVDYGKKFGGMAGDVSVRIYDMQYSPENVAASALTAALPPSVRLRGTARAETGEALEPGTNPVGGGAVLNAGVYLIRAVVTFQNGVTNKIDVSVIQNSNPKA
jgi:hypothetical protein